MTDLDLVYSQVKSAPAVSNETVGAFFSRMSNMSLLHVLWQLFRTGRCP